MPHDAVSPPPAPPSGVRTTRRRGRTSATQQEALAVLGQVWQVPPDRVGTTDEVTVAFGVARPLLVDIGVGDGRATRDWAEANPHANVLAIELHRPGIAKLLRALDASGPANVRLIEGDALAVLDDLAEGSVAGIRVLFPDPWPKRRHVRRRLVDRAFVSRTAAVLVPGGHLHLATDWSDYAEHMRSMVATEPRFVAQEPGTRPPRPVTAYEQRGLSAGRTISDMVFTLEPRPSA